MRGSSTSLSIWMAGWSRAEGTTTEILTCGQNDELESQTKVWAEEAPQFFGFETISLLHRLPCINSLALWLASALF